MDLEIDLVADGRDSRFGAVADLFREESAAYDPGDPVPSDRYVERDLYGLPPDRVRLVYGATADGRPAGFATATGHAEGDGRIKLAEVQLFVTADLRRRGVADAIVARIVPDLVERDFTSIIAYPCTTLFADEGVGLCTRFGLTKRQEERCSRAVVADIDDELMARWVADAETKAAGYRIEQWEGPCPDHLLDAWCTAATGMADAPLDDVDFDPQIRGPEQQRVADQAFVARGYRIFRILALAPDGEPAGLSALFVHTERPPIGHQDDTTVLAPHRGHGIGRWLKAANYQLAAEAVPELSVIETYNAESNPWMLDINVAMGFEPYRTYVAYQAPIEDVIRALG